MEALIKEKVREALERLMNDEAIIVDGADFQNHLWNLVKDDLTINLDTDVQLA